MKCASARCRRASWFPNSGRPNGRRGGSDSAPDGTAKPHAVLSDSPILGDLANDEQSAAVFRLRLLPDVGRGECGAGVTYLHVDHPICHGNSEADEVVWPGVGVPERVRQELGRGKHGIIDGRMVVSQPFTHFGACA